MFLTERECELQSMAGGKHISWYRISSQQSESEHYIEIDADKMLFNHWKMLVSDSDDADCSPEVPQS